MLNSCVVFTYVGSSVGITETLAVCFPEMAVRDAGDARKVARGTWSAPEEAAALIIGVTFSGIASDNDPLTTSKMLDILRSRYEEMKEEIDDDAENVVPSSYIWLMPSSHSLFFSSFERSAGPRSA